MKTILAATMLLLATVSARAQSAPKPVPVGTPVTIAAPTDSDDVLLRLVGLQCKAATKLVPNKDGTFDGSITCGSITLKGKRLTLGNAAPPAPDLPKPPTAMTDPRVESGVVTILGIGPNDLFLARSGELVGKVCNVTKPLVRDAKGFYAGELTCGANRYYFAQVSVASGAVVMFLTGNTPVPDLGPQPGEQWRIVDAGDVYPSINTTDCLTWPTTDMKSRGGENVWRGFYTPRTGDVGVVLGKSRHCSQDIDVVFLQVGAYVVPIGARGIVRN